MKTILKTDLTVRDINEGFVYNEYEGKGLFGWGGKLTIQPEYQRTLPVPRSGYSHGHKQPHLTSAAVFLSLLS